MDLHHGLRAVSIDVITDYAFGQSYGLLETPDLGYEFFMLVQRLGPAAWIFRQVPWLKAIIKITPEPIIRAVSEPISQVIDMQRVSINLRRGLYKAEFDFLASALQ